MKHDVEWRVYGQSVRGAAHERLGLPNQDAIRWLPASGVGPPIILGVSDGHGSAKSFRSDVGSRLAVEQGAWMVQDLLDGQPDPTNLSAVKRTAEDYLPREIVRRWQEMVQEHLAKNPFTPEELDIVAEQQGEDARRKVEENPLLAYGATILIVLVTTDFILYLQLGDGDILVVNEDGQVNRPLPKDERLFANETTSLCRAEAWLDVRFRFQAIFDKPPALILLSTDGYSNSYRNDADFMKIGTDMLEIIRTEGIQMIRSNLEDWLEETTRAGSGDDITLGILYLTEPMPAVDESAQASDHANAGTALQNRTDLTNPSHRKQVSPEEQRYILKRKKQQGPIEPSKQKTDYS
jgi:serine/threonine protein phosphatase PrpC